MLPKISHVFSNGRHFFCLANKIHHFSLVIRKNVKKSGQRNRDSTWSRALFICRSLLQHLLQCLCMCRWRQHKWHYLGTKPVWIMVCLEKNKHSVKWSSWCFVMFLGTLDLIYIFFVEKKQSLMLQWLKAMGMICIVPFWADNLGRIVMTTGLVPQRHIGRSAKSIKIVQFLESNSISNWGPSGNLLFPNTASFRNS